jgi:hypothetical protein
MSKEFKLVFEPERSFKISWPSLIVWLGFSQLPHI